MTAPNPALAQLKDIQTPEAIGAWPIAIGYWLILLLAVLLIATLVYLYRNKQKQSRIKQAALTELAKLALSDNTEFAVQVNAILKRAALSYLPRQHIASVDGNQWYQFLDNSLPQAQQGQFSKLLNQRYSKHGLTAQDNQQLAELAKLWLKKSLPLNESAINSLLRVQNKEAKC